MDKYIYIYMDIHPESVLNGYRWLPANQPVNVYVIKGRVNQTDSSWKVLTCVRKGFLIVLKVLFGPRKECLIFSSFMKYRASFNQRV